jgi:hypothetical protein
VVVALLLRLWGHAGYLHDSESLMVPTVGREIGHGHWREAIFYQYNLTQGGILIDGGLAGLGFEVFGDHLLAWKWYALAYAAAGTVFGMIILKRTAGAAAAVVWPLLLMAAPFVLKDGLLTPAGHHSTGFVWALGALAVALGGSAEKPSWQRGLLAGALLGVAMFYMRTAVSAGPAVAIALLRGGWKPLIASGVGTLAFPALAVWNTSAFVAAVSPYKEWGFQQTFATLLGAPRAESVLIEYGPKVSEALSWRLKHIVFAQAPLPQGGPEPMALMESAGIAWSAAWSVTPVLVLVLTGLLLINRKRDPQGAARLWGTAVIAALAAGYLATYVASPFRIDPFLLDPPAGTVYAPGSSGPRYLVPPWLALSVAMAHVLGMTLQDRWLRFPAALALGGLLVLGLGSAGADVWNHREPPGTWSTLQPFAYPKMFGPHRGPAQEVHASCSRGDPISRANHLRAAGWFRKPSLEELLRDTIGRQDAVTQMQADHPMTQDELAFVIEGFGLGFADALHSADRETIVRAIDATVRGANGQPIRAHGDAFLQGFASGFPEDQLTENLNKSFVDRACQPTRHGDIQPLCARIGGAVIRVPIAHLPDLPHDLYENFPTELLDGPVGPDLLRGAGRRLARSCPWLEDEVLHPEEALEQGIELWPVSLAEAFVEGWNQGTTTLHWAPGDPWTPASVP